MKNTVLCFILACLCVIPAYSEEVIPRDIYIDNSCTISDASLQYDRVHVGCNAPTSVNVANNAVIGWLFLYNSYVNMAGGAIVQDLIANNNSRGWICGGTVSKGVEVWNNSILRLCGTNFTVTDMNGVTTALKPGHSLREFGTLISEAGRSYYTGTITGTLAYGSALNNIFMIDAYSDADILVYRFMAYGPRIIALSQGNETGLLMKKNSAVIVGRDHHPLANEAVVINSSGADALRIQGSAYISADSLTVVGGITVKGDFSHPEDMAVTQNTYGMEDFFEVEEPQYSELPDMCPVDPGSQRASPLVINGGQAILQPGYYSAGIIINGASVTMQPGIYSLGSKVSANSGLILKEGAVVDANNVMFHIVEPGQVSIDASSKLNAAAPQSGPYQGFQFFQSLQNTNPAVFKGNVDCAGMLYFPLNHVQIEGSLVCTGLFADTIELSVNSTLTVP